MEAEGFSRLAHRTLPLGTGDRMGDSAITLSEQAVGRVGGRHRQSVA